MNKEKIQIYLKSLINKKDILIKGIIVVISTIIISLLVFLLRQHFLNSKTQDHEFMGYFISIKITLNTGISFGNLKNNVAAAYAIQLIFVILVLVIAIFTKDKICFSCLYVAAFSGICNLIDRGLSDRFMWSNSIWNNAVVDYFYFKFIPESAIWNVQDSLIVCSMIVLFINCIYLIIKRGKHDENQVQRQ